MKKLLYVLVVVAFAGCSKTGNDTPLNVAMGNAGLRLDSTYMYVTSIDTIVHSGIDTGYINFHSNSTITETNKKGNTVTIKVSYTPFSSYNFPLYNLADNSAEAMSAIDASSGFNVMPMFNPKLKLRGVSVGTTSQIAYSDIYAESTVVNLFWPTVWVIK